MEVPRGFTRCDECGGKGWFSGYPQTPYEQCPSCRGSGLLPTEKLVEAVARSMQELAPNAPLRWFAMARAALTEVARWGKE